MRFTHPPLSTSLSPVRCTLGCWLLPPVAMCFRVTSGRHRGEGGDGDPSVCELRVSLVTVCLTAGCDKELLGVFSNYEAC